MKKILFLICCATILTSCGVNKNHWAKQDEVESVIQTGSTSSPYVAATSTTELKNEPVIEVDTTTTELTKQTTAITSVSSADTTPAKHKEKTSSETEIENHNIVEVHMSEEEYAELHSESSIIIEDEEETTAITSSTISPKEEEVPLIEDYIIDIDPYSYQLLAEMVEHEAGCSWIDMYDKARIVSAIMERVYDERFPNTVAENLADQTQFPGYYPECIIPSEEAYEAVDYYFANPWDFDNSNSWYGDSYQNYFYYQ